MSRLIQLLLLTLALTGCASMSTETRATEAAWQVLNAMDTASTDQLINKSPCCIRESGQWRYVIGEHPTTTQIYAMGAMWGMAHFGVTAWLAEIEAPRWVQRGWQLVTISATGITVSKNFSLYRDVRRPPPATSIAPRNVDTQPIRCTGATCQ